MHKIRFLLYCLIIISLIAFAKNGHAQYNYYQHIIGDRAAGLGGSYVALADDSTALWYNPAGLANIKANSINISANGYNYMNAKITGFYEIQNTLGRYESVDFKASDVSVVAHTLVYGLNLKEYGFKGVASFGVFVPYESAFQGKMDGHVLGRNFETILKADYNEESKYLKMMFGYSLPKFVKNLAIGFSGGLGYYKEHSRSTDIIYLARLSDGAITNSSSFEDYKITEYLFTTSFGAQYQIHPQHAVGAKLTSGSYSLHGKAETEVLGLMSGTGSYTTDLTSYEYVNTTIVDKDDRFEKILPWFFTMGYTYKNLIVFGNPSTLTVDLEIISTVDEAPNSVANLKTGFETLLMKQYTVRCGFFTDLSPADDVTRTSTNTIKMDYYGFALSFSFFSDILDDDKSEKISSRKRKKRKRDKTDLVASIKEKKLCTTVGVIYRVGMGDAQTFRYDINFNETSIIRNQTISSLTLYVGESVMF